MIISRNSKTNMNVATNIDALSSGVFSNPTSPTRQSTTKKKFFVTQGIIAKTAFQSSMNVLHSSNLESETNDETPHTEFQAGKEVEIG
jgi:hypothetical protein